MWLPRQNQGGGSVLVPEQTSGVDDQAEYLREHLGPLRQAVPVQLTARPAEVSDVHLYRVGGQLLRSGMQVVGAGPGQ
jgi:hypothetical protein